MFWCHLSKKRMEIVRKENDTVRAHFFVIQIVRNKSLAWAIWVFSFPKKKPSTMIIIIIIIIRDSISLFISRHSERRNFTSNSTFRLHFNHIFFSFSSTAKKPKRFNVVIVLALLQHVDCVNDNLFQKTNNNTKQRELHSKTINKRWEKFHNFYSISFSLPSP